METFRLSAQSDSVPLYKIIKLNTLNEATKRVEGMIRFMSLMPLDIPNRDVHWSIELKGRDEKWHVILAGKARAR